MSSTCRDCGKTFGSCAAAQQHRRDAHLKSQRKFKCTTCTRRFSSERARAQHFEAVHELQDTSQSCSDEESSAEEDHDHDDPFDGAEGEWVERERCPKMKSFGMFQCPRCDNRWKSAHAFKQKFRQGCKRCEYKSQPCCMWWNPLGDTRERDDTRDRGPHDGRRCEACKAGCCSGGITGQRIDC